MARRQGDPAAGDGPDARGRPWTRPGSAPPQPIASVTNTESAERFVRHVEREMVIKPSECVSLTTTSSSAEFLGAAAALHREARSSNPQDHSSRDPPQMQSHGRYSAPLHRPGRACGTGVRFWTGRGNALAWRVKQKSSPRATAARRGGCSSGQDRASASSRWPISASTAARSSRGSHSPSQEHPVSLRRLFAASLAASTPIGAGWRQASRPARVRRSIVPPRTHQKRQVEPSLPNVDWRHHVRRVTPKVGGT